MICLPSIVRIEMCRWCLMLPETVQASYEVKGSIECPDSLFVPLLRMKKMAKSASTTTSKDMRPVERLDNLDVKHSHGVRFCPLPPSIGVLHVTKSDQVQNTAAPTHPFEE